jgi:hypothetical protein
LHHLYRRGRESARISWRTFEWECGASASLDRWVLSITYSLLALPLTSCVRIIGLTEFMQEMDGLTSAGSNREARVSVVAATNRPFVRAPITTDCQTVLIRNILPASNRTWTKPFFDVCLEGKQECDMGSVEICPNVISPLIRLLIDLPTVKDREGKPHGERPSSQRN